LRDFHRALLSAARRANACWRELADGPVTPENVTPEEAHTLTTSVDILLTALGRLRERLESVPRLVSVPDAGEGEP
jgi:hypothetical protein